MEKKTASYEALFAVDATLADDAIKALVEKFTTLIKDNACDVVVNEWGKRRLAYPINYKNEGYYVLVNFVSGTDFPAELVRVFRITEGIIRCIVTSSNGQEVAAAAPVETEAQAEETAPVSEEVPAEQAE